MCPAYQSAKANYLIRAFQPFEEYRNSDILLSFCRVHALCINFQFFHSFLGTFNVELALARQPGEGCRCDGFCIDFKVAAQVLAIVASSEAICSQRDQSSTKPRRQLVWNCLKVISGRNNWPFSLCVL